MTFGQFIAILRARWWVLLLVLAVTVGTAVGVSLVLPKQYQATASVVVDFKPDPVSAVVYGGMPSPALMATQVDILKSDRVALRVVRNLRLAENASVRTQWQEATEGQGSIEQWLVTLMQKKLAVLPSRESSVINVTYEAPDPAFAAALANAFVQAYIDTALELRVNPARQFSGFFDQQAKEMREALERAQAKLSAFQKANGIIATDERMDVETARLAELSSQLVALQAVAGESRSRQAQAQGAGSDRLQEVVTNPLVSGLKADVARAEARLQELNSRLGDSHPQVVEAKATLDSLRARLETETRRVAGSVGVTSTINTQREAQVRAALEEQRTKLLRLKAVRDEGLVLQRDVESAQRAYDAVQQRLSQTTMESQATQSNVSRLTDAVAPNLPSSPKIVLNTALAIFLGTLLGLGTVLLLELTDRRVRSAEDVVAALELPVIGVMLEPNARRRSALVGKRMLALPGAPQGPQAAQALPPAA